MFVASWCSTCFVCWFWYGSFCHGALKIDTIDRNILWRIIADKGIKGNMYYSLLSMYTSVNACRIKCSSGRSDYVNSSVGLKQGCLASPILFSLFIDELITYFNRNDVKGIQIHPDTIQIFALMFADDMTLISDTVRGLQMQLNLLYFFCR